VSNAQASGNAKIGRPARISPFSRSPFIAVSLRRIVLNASQSAAASDDDALRRAPARSASGPNKSKQNQAEPNKSEQKCLVLFGFIRPNRDFSTSYGESKYKKSVPLSHCGSNITTSFALWDSAGGAMGAGSIRLTEICIT
jgi:hypothetical protein